MEGTGEAGPSNWNSSRSSLPERMSRRRSARGTSHLKRKSSLPCWCAIAVTAASTFNIASAAVLPHVQSLSTALPIKDAAVRAPLEQSPQATIQSQWRVLGIAEEAAFVEDKHNYWEGSPTVALNDFLRPLRTAAPVLRIVENSEEHLHDHHKRAPASSMTAPSSTAKARTSARPTTLMERAPQATMAPTTTTTVASSTTSTRSISTSTAVPSNFTLPQPFDTTLGTNFTSTACPSFFRTFLSNPQFIACTPFSFLLSTSNAFFTAARSPYSLLPAVLDAACAAPVDTCVTLMNQLQGQLQKTSTCGNDLSRRNPLVLEALEGFENYQMLYQAGCQRNNVTSQYCFAEANIANDPSELYYYYLPEGTSLPSGTVPGCGSCTQDLLTLYSQYAGNQSLPISQTYSAARTATALTCGPNFAPLISVTASSNAKTSRYTSPGALALTLATLIITFAHLSLQ